LAHNRLFEKVGKFEEHQNVPKSLSCPRNGPKTESPASYHRLIIIMTITLTRNYTDLSAGAKAIMREVYSYFPLE
jgi:hypothetical protein